MRDSERIADLEYRVEILEACLADIERRLKLKRRPVPPRPPTKPFRSGAVAGPVRLVGDSEHLG
ncbi:MAG: hypothetical protein EHM63_02435 [Actinobacteria bacterium]|nr:MAG: hypothetical protein EHM63_02435 [Actinomycetota bacterium]